MILAIIDLLFAFDVLIQVRFLVKNTTQLVIIRPFAACSEVDQVAWGYAQVFCGLLIIHSFWVDRLNCHTISPVLQKSYN